MKLIINRKRVLAIFIILLLWNAGIWLTPFLASSSYSLFKSFATGLYQLYDPVCHQLPERSWHFAGIPLPTCIRCTVFYFSCLMITLYYLLRGSLILFPVAYYILLVLPTVFDFTLEITGFYYNLPLIRIITAIPLAYALFHCLVRSVSSR